MIVRRTLGSSFIEPLKFMTVIWGVLIMISNYHYLSKTNFLKRSFSYRGVMARNQLSNETREMGDLTSVKLAIS